MPLKRIRASTGVLIERERAKPGELFNMITGDARKTDAQQIAAAPEAIWRFAYQDLSETFPAGDIDTELSSLWAHCLSREPSNQYVSEIIPY